MLYGLAFLMGVVASRLLFGGTAPGPFEQSLMYNLSLGKRVIISVDNECYIFEMIENKLRITRGTTDFYEEPADGMEHTGVVGVAPDQPIVGPNIDT